MISNTRPLPPQQAHFFSLFESVRVRECAVVAGVGVQVSVSCRRPGLVFQKLYLLLPALSWNPGLLFLRDLKYI